MFLQNFRQLSIRQGNDTVINNALLFNCRILPRGNKRKLSPMLVWIFDSLKTILKVKIDF